MTDDKKTPQANESVKELLGEVHRPWYVRALPWVVVLAIAGGGIGSRIGRQEARCSM